MNTIFDYLLWRGDLTFKESPLNEVDSLVFCAFSYFKIEELMHYKEFVSIQELYQKYNLTEEDTLFNKNQNHLFRVLSESKRFKDVLITHYFNEVDKKLEMQIAGMTFILPNETLFVAFKGTDGTITGWKENFDLSYKSIIPAQRRAVEYLDEILMHTQKNVYVGGHSKGGNLAMYASIFCQKNDNIVKTYNHDGPGFHGEIVEGKNYQKFKERMVTFIPKASIVGNIFDKDTKTIIIKSKQIGLLQHDLYSWAVSGNHFVYTNELNKDVKKLSNSLNEIIEKIPKEQKKKVVSFLYEVLESWNINDIENLIKDVFLSKSILSQHHFNQEDFAFLFKILPLILEIIKKV